MGQKSVEYRQRRCFGIDKRIDNANEGREIDGRGGIGINYAIEESEGKRTGGIMGKTHVGKMLNRFLGRGQNDNLHIRPVSSVHLLEYAQRPVARIPHLGTRLLNLDTA